MKKYKSSAQRNPKTSTASLRKGAKTGSSKPPYALKPPASKLPAKTIGTDA